MNKVALIAAICCSCFVVDAVSQERFISADDQCQVSVIQKDRKGRAVQRQTKMAPLTTYTPTKLVNYYKDRDYLTVNVATGKGDGEPYLDVEFRFYSKDVSRGYGVIRPSDVSFLTTLGGTKIYLNPAGPINSEIEQYTGNTIYRGSFRFANKGDYKSLKKYSIDSFNVLWSSGYESYPVYDIDFFIKQTACLDGKK